MQYLGATSKTDISFQGKPFNTTVIQVYVPTTDVEKAEVDWFREDLQYLLELTPQKRCPFHHSGLECKCRKSRDTQDKRKTWPYQYIIEQYKRLTQF